MFTFILLLIFVLIILPIMVGVVYLWIAYIEWLIGKIVEWFYRHHS